MIILCSSGMSVDNGYENSGMNMAEQKEPPYPAQKTTKYYCKDMGSNSRIRSHSR
jgi:hypothetical protein